MILSGVENARALVQATRRSAAGMTVAERVAAGQGSVEDLAWHKDQVRNHEAWKRSELGQAWLKSRGIR